MSLTAFLLALIALSLAGNAVAAVAIVYLRARHRAARDAADAGSLRLMGAYLDRGGRG